MFYHFFSFSFFLLFSIFIVSLSQFFSAVFEQLKVIYIFIIFVLFSDFDSSPFFPAIPFVRCGWRRWIPHMLFTGVNAFPRFPLLPYYTIHVFTWCFVAQTFKRFYSSWYSLLLPFFIPKPSVLRMWFWCVNVQLHTSSRCLNWFQFSTNTSNVWQFLSVVHEKRHRHMRHSLFYTMNENHRNDIVNVKFSSFPPHAV